MNKYQNFINGEWQNPLTGKWIENINPATGELIGYYPRSGKEDIAMARDAAKKAFKAWKNMPAPERAEIIYKAIDYYKANKENFAVELCNEMGKVFNECLGDVQELIDMGNFCAGEGRRNLGMITPSDSANRFVMSYREPLGIVGIITPWNYPVGMPAWKVFPALITGNTVIFKPAEDTPHSAINMIKGLEQAGIPKGVLNLVIGIGNEAGEALVEQEGVNLISFTGSTKVGTRIAEKCPSQYKRVALEMGGKNSVIVLKDADLDLAVAGIMKSVFATSGQRCASAGKIIVEKEISGELTERLINAANKLKLGKGIDPETELGPVINKVRLKNIEADVNHAVEQGANILCGGKIADEGELKNGNFFLPTFLNNISPDMEIAQKETFGPVASIITVNGPKEAIEVVNNVQYGLTGAVFTQDIDKAMIIRDEIEVGVFFINAACVGGELSTPFGGFKASGNGKREGSHAMLDIYTEWKSVYIQHRSYDYLK